MYLLTWELDIFGGRADEPLSPVDVAVFRECLEACIRINVIHLRSGRYPSFEFAAANGLVVYVDPGSVDDNWRTVPRILETGEADCDDALGWAGAQWRLQGRNVVPRFTAGPHPDGSGRRAVHVFLDVNGRRVDPSAMLHRKR